MTKPPPTPRNPVRNPTSSAASTILVVAAASIPRRLAVVALVPDELGYRPGLSEPPVVASAAAGTNWSEPLRVRSSMPAAAMIIRAPKQSSRTWGFTVRFSAVPR